MLQNRGALPRKDGDVLREYQALLEQNFLSSWLREYGEGNEEERKWFYEGSQRRGK